MTPLRKMFSILGAFLAMFHWTCAEEIHVAFCLDNNYAEPTGVAAYSLCKNRAPDDHLVIHIVMAEPLKPEHKEKFRQLETMFPQEVKVQIHDDEHTIQMIDKALEIPYGWRKMGKDACFNKGMGTRLVLDNILPQELSKVIYLDSDVLVFDSLKNLWQKLPKTSYAVGGISCMRRREE